MRILRDNPSDKNSVQNLFTEVNELKSTSNSTISACGLSFRISSFSSAALLKSLAGITILTPFFANTLAVSAPIPDVAPLKKKIEITKPKSFYLVFYLWYMCFLHESFVFYFF